MGRKKNISFLVPAVKQDNVTDCFLSKELISMHILDSSGLFLKALSLFHWLET